MGGSGGACDRIAVGATQLVHVKVRLLVVLTREQSTRAWLIRPAGHNDSLFCAEQQLVLTVLHTCSAAAC